MKQKVLSILALLLMAVTSAWAQKTYTVKIEANGNSFTKENVALPYTFWCDFSSENGELDLIIRQLYNYSQGYCANNTPPTASGNDNVTAGNSGNNAYFTINAPFEGTATVSGLYNPYTSFLTYNLVISISDYVPTSAGYTVSLKSGVKDADKWTVKVGEGQAQALPIGGLKGDGSETVTLQYTGRLKVKGVKATSEAAPAAKPAATVTTAPTGAAIVGVGKTTALVSGGAADGGTLWYAVTTTNTKPASTDGFSATVPTAQTITASGKVYVWYYVKADDTHSDSEIAATAIEVPVADIVWDITNVTDLNVSGTKSYTKEGVTLSCNGDMTSASWSGYGNPEKDGISFTMMESGGYTFTAPTGKKFTKIEMTPVGAAGWDEANLGSDWAFAFVGEMICAVTWKGSAAASTVDLLTGADEFIGGEKAKCIAFYLSE